MQKSIENSKVINFYITSIFLLFFLYLVYECLEISLDFKIISYKIFDKDGYEIFRNLQIRSFLHFGIGIYASFIFLFGIILYKFQKDLPKLIYYIYIVIIPFIFLIITIVILDFIFPFSKRRIAVFILCVYPSLLLSLVFIRLNTNQLIILTGTIVLSFLVLFSYKNQNDRVFDYKSYQKELQTEIRKVNKDSEHLSNKMNTILTSLQEQFSLGKYLLSSEIKKLNKHVVDKFPPIFKIKLNIDKESPYPFQYKLIVSSKHFKDAYYYTKLQQNIGEIIAVDKDLNIIPTWVEYTGKKEIHLWVNILANYEEIYFYYNPVISYSFYQNNGEAVFPFFIAKQNVINNIPSNVSVFYDFTEDDLIKRDALCNKGIVANAVFIKDNSKEFILKTCGGVLSFNINLPPGFNSLTIHEKFADLITADPKNQNSSVGLGSKRNRLFHIKHPIFNNNADFAGMYIFYPTGGGKIAYINVEMSKNSFFNLKINLNFKDKTTEYIVFNESYKELSKYTKDSFQDNTLKEIQIGGGCGPSENTLVKYKFIFVSVNPDKQVSYLFY
jgi:hypothetical protein